MEELKPNRIICGDTIEELKKLPARRAGLIFADPPYWMMLGPKDLKTTLSILGWE